jgi:hypothetical protein
MYLRVSLATFVAVMLAVTGVAAQANKVQLQAVGTLQIDSLGGAVTPIYAFGFEVTSSFSLPGGGGGAGKSTLTDVQVSRLPDAISPTLFRTGVLGTHLPVVRIVLSGAGKNAPDSTYVLNDVFISGFSNTDGLERVSFKFESIELLVGGTQFCYDVTTNKAC